MKGVYCFDLKGNKLWSKDLGSYPMMMGYGTGSSPVIDDGRLFIQCDNERNSFLMALDAKTGDELWRVKRGERSSWSTPFIWKNKERTEVVCLSTPRVCSYDPVKGKQLWHLDGLTGQPKASPVGTSELLYLGMAGFGFGGGFGRGEGGGRGGYPGGSSRTLYAIKAGAFGDITLKDGVKSNEGVAWRIAQAAPSTSSPLVYDGCLYILEDYGGLLNCYDAKTGKKLYKERLPGAGGFTASPWAYAGKVFCLDQDGKTFVVQAGRNFKVLGKNTIAEMFWSSPAVAGGSLLLRGVDHVYCIRQEDSTKSKS
jgi:outer membrane protein assembly factor BamB